MRNLPGFHKKLTWQPWTNTMIYYPFRWDISDHSGNNRNATASWTVVYQTNYIDLSNASLAFPLLTYSCPFTVSIWYNLFSERSADYRFVYWISGSNIISNIMIWHKYNWGYVVQTDKPSFKDLQLWTQSPVSARYDWVWHNVISSFSTSGTSFYKDGVLLWTNTWWTGSDTAVGSDINSSMQWMYCWEFIIDGTAWTQQEVTDYYNLTKSNYWL
jgi:hypothetical protein